MLQSLPSAKYTELDQSTVPPAQLSDYHGLVTPTLFGPTDKPYLVTDVDGYNATFGIGGTFYAQIKRALARGAAFFVHRLTATGAAAASVALDTSKVTVTAKWLGAYANGKLSVAYTPKGANPTCQMVIAYSPNPLLNEVFSAASYTALITVINAQSNLVTIAALSGSTEPANTSNAPLFLATGADGAFANDAAKTTAITAILPHFNSLAQLDTIGVLGAYTAADAANILSYAEGRGDVLALFELDPSITPAAAATAAAALGLPVGSSHIAVYWGSYILAWSPDDSAYTQQSVLTDVMAVYSFSDTISNNTYRAPAGGKRGLLSNVREFAYNMLSPGESVVANQLVQAGVNIVGDHLAFGPCVWGAQTMNQKNSSLDAISTRRMMFWLRHQLQPIFDIAIFEPQDPTSWLLAYNKVKPILQRLVADRAVASWQYIGDQNASDIDHTLYNNRTDLLNGIYKALVNIIAVGYISQIGFTVEVNNQLSQFQTAD